MGNYLGIGGGYFHDASAAFVQDGTLLAFAEEERFSRRKHHADSRSCGNAISHCLQVAGIQIGDLDGVAYGWNDSWPASADMTFDSDLARELFGGAWSPDLRGIPFTHVPHHVAHASSAFFPSGHGRAAVLVVDGSGDGVSTSLWTGDRLTGLHLIREYPYTQSLGWFYETLTECVGFGHWTDTGKMMGLAPYGSAVYELPFVSADDGSYRIDLTKYGVERDPMPGRYSNLSYYKHMKKAYARALADIQVPSFNAHRVFDARRGRLVATTSFGQHQRDLAASAQQVLENCLLQLVGQALRESGTDVLCLAGGVALNCTANGVIARETALSDMYVQPAAGDSGIAIGCAFNLAHQAGELPASDESIRSYALGPSFSNDAIEAALTYAGVRATRLDHDTMIRESVELLANGNTLGWFQGKAEGGPRALGNRSILATATSTQMRDRLNRDVKRREMWRPLAPSMLASVSDDLIVDKPQRADFMIVAHMSTETACDRVPAVVHVDGSMRPQIVEDAAATPYARLLRELRAESGVGVVLNTSFNDETEPVVNNPTDALRTFFSTGLDALAIGDYVVKKAGGGE